MKSNTYRGTDYTGKTYCKKVGSGWETGFTFNNRTVFVGNFIHEKEANHWYSIMTREVTRFTWRYQVGNHFPKTWYGQFLKNHLYKTYYRYLDKVFAHYHRTYGKAWTRDVKKYNTLSKTWHHTHTHCTPVFKKAA
jgi:hypothetical protein